MFSRFFSLFSDLPTPEGGHARAKETPHIKNWGCPWALGIPWERLEMGWAVLSSLDLLMDLLLVFLF